MPNDDLDLDVEGFKEFAFSADQGPDDRSRSQAPPTPGDRSTDSLPTPEKAADARWRRRMWRSSISGDALLTAEEVAEALPGRAQLNRRWLDRVPRVRLPNGQEVYQWAEVLRHLERVA